MFNAMDNIISVHDLYSLIDEAPSLSDWMPVAQERICLFADATEDRQFIHIDPEKATETPFGGTIAHGMLLLSLVPPLVFQTMPIPEGFTLGINYGFDKVRFLKPVLSGSRVRTSTEMLKLTEKREGQLLANYAVKLHVEGSDEPALVCEWLHLFHYAADYL